MKKITYLLLTSLFLVTMGACKHTETTFTINGEIPMNEFEGCPIYLRVINNDSTLDSAIVKEGKFAFQGTLEKAMMGRIICVSQKSSLQCSSTLVLEKGKIYINLVSDSLSGTPLNDLFFKNYTADPVTKDWVLKREACLNAYYAAEEPEDQEAALAQYGQADSGYTAHLLEISRKIYKDNPKNILGAYALSQIVSYDGITFDSLDYILAHAAPVVADYEPLRKARTLLFHVAATSEGKKYTDIQGIDYATGLPASLSGLIDTSCYTLIDFWASWCSPCRQEITENLIRLYDEYHGKGLNIIGIDVWDKIDSHKAAVEQLGIRYPQFIDTTSLATTTYGIEGVPTILLIDKQGIIVKRNLRGSDIEDAVLKALNINPDTDTDTPKKKKNNKK